MSTLDAVKGLVAKGELHQVLVAPGTPTIRDLYVTTAVNEWIIERPLTEGPWEDQKDADRWAQANGDLRRFLVAKKLPVRRQGKRYKGPSYILRLDPGGEEVWEIRSRDDPHIRFFGRFAECDAFVVLFWRYRCQFKTEQDYEKVRRECADEWRNLLSHHDWLARPKKGFPHEYLSGSYLVP